MDNVITHYCEENGTMDISFGDQEDEYIFTEKGDLR